MSNKGAGLQLCPARECYAGEIDWEALPPLVTRPVSERGVAEVLRPESERSPIAEGEKVFFFPPSWQVCCRVVPWCRCGVAPSFFYSFFLFCAFDWTFSVVGWLDG